MKVFPFSPHSIDILLKGVSMYPQVYSSVPLQHKQSPITCPSCGFLIPYVNGSTASFSWPPSHRRHGPRTHRGRRSTDKPTRKLCHKVQTLFRRTPGRHSSGGHQADTLQADTSGTLFRRTSGTLQADTLQTDTLQASEKFAKGPDTLQGREIFAKGPVTLQGSEIICALNLLFSNPFVPTHKGDL